MKNRKREICTSGSVRDEDGQPPHLLGHRRQFLHLAAGAAALLAVSCVAWAQSYPIKPVRLIVGFAPAGGTDITARLIGQWLSERLSQQFIIENRPGAGSNIATEAVVRAPPDGYTLLVATSANAFNATLYDKLNFNFIRDIAPVAGIIIDSCDVLPAREGIGCISVNGNDATSSRCSAVRPRGRSRRAQQPTMPVVGFLHLTSRDVLASSLG